MNTYQIIRKSVDAPSLLLGVSGVLFGLAAASAEGQIHFMPAILALLFVFFCQCNTNIGHRYLDDKYDRGENRADGMYEGEKSLLTVRETLYEGVKICSILEATVGLAILATSGWWTITFAILTFVAMVFSNMGPRPLFRSKVFPILTGLMFGPAIVCGTALMQFAYDKGLDKGVTTSAIISIVLFSILAGILAFMCHVFVTIREQRNDFKIGKGNFASIFKRTSAYFMLFTVTIIATTLSVLIPFLLKMHHIYAAIPLPILMIIPIGMVMKGNRYKAAVRCSILIMMICAFFYAIIYPIAFFY